MWRGYRSEFPAGALTKPSCCHKNERCETDRISTTTSEQICRVLALDGGGAKGFYTLGVLKEIEGLVNKPLHECFDLVFGTSTGAIIAALIALGRSVDEIHE